VSLRGEPTNRRVQFFLQTTNVLSNTIAGFRCKINLTDCDVDQILRNDASSPSTRVIIQAMIAYLCDETRVSSRCGWMDGRLRSSARVQEVLARWGDVVMPLSTAKKRPPAECRQTSDVLPTPLWAQHKLVVQATLNNT